MEGYRNKVVNYMQLYSRLLVNLLVKLARVKVRGPWGGPTEPPRRPYSPLVGGAIGPWAVSTNAQGFIDLCPCGCHGNPKGQGIDKLSLEPRARHPPDLIQLVSPVNLLVCLLILPVNLLAFLGLYWLVNRSLDL